MDEPSKHHLTLIYYNFRASKSRERDSKGVPAQRRSQLPLREVSPAWLLSWYGNTTIYYCHLTKHCDHNTMSAPNDVETGVAPLEVELPPDPETGKGEWLFACVCVCRCDIISFHHGLGQIIFIFYSLVSLLCYKSPRTAPHQS